MNLRPYVTVKELMTALSKYPEDTTVLGLSGAVVGTVLGIQESHDVGDIKNIVMVWYKDESDIEILGDIHGHSEVSEINEDISPPLIPEIIASQLLHLDNLYTHTENESYKSMLGLNIKNLNGYDDASKTYIDLEKTLEWNERMYSQEHEELKIALMSSGMNQYIEKLKLVPAKCVLNYEEAMKYLETDKTIMCVKNSGLGVYFFTDNYLIGRLKEIRIIPPGFVPSSGGLPLEVTPREGLADGIIKTLDDYISVFCKNLRRLETVDELVDLLLKLE